MQVHIYKNSEQHRNNVYSNRTSKGIGKNLGITKMQERLPGDFPGGSDGKASACNAGEPGLIPESGRYPGEGNGNPLQYSCLENPMYRGAW